MSPRPSEPPDSDPVNLTRLQAEYFSGPIPSPSLLARYNEVIPDGAERILAMAERQSAHRERLESLVVDRNLAAQTRGSWFAFVICLVAIVDGLFLVYEDKSAAGLASIVVSLGTLAGVFAYAKQSQKRERIDKAQALKSRRSS